MDEDPTLPDANPPTKPVIQAKKKKGVLSRRDIEARKNAKVEEIKTRYAEKERYAAERAKQTEMGMIEKARFKRINTALGRPQVPGAQNFVVEKPLEPNALDFYQDKKIKQRDQIEARKSFVPVQKL
jgi:hypothetical protein